MRTDRWIQSLLLAALCLAPPLLSSALAQAGQQSQRNFPWAGQDASMAIPPIPTSRTGNVTSRDFSGVWLRSGPSSLTAKPPEHMTAKGKALWDQTITGRTNAARVGVPPVSTNDPTSWCDPFGFPRILTAFARPIEMVELPDRIIQFFEWSHVWRDIWMDGRRLPNDADPRWMGYSVGRWEDDTLIVDTVGLDESAWLDQYGYRHSGNARFEERYRRLDATTIELKMTLTDPEIYSEPWVSDVHTLRMLPRPGWPANELREEFCAPSEEGSFNERLRDRAGGKTTPGPR